MGSSMSCAETRGWNEILRLVSESAAHFLLVPQMSAYNSLAHASPSLSPGSSRLPAEPLAYAWTLCGVLSGLPSPWCRNRFWEMLHNRLRPPLNSGAGSLDEAALLRRERAAT